MAIELKGVRTVTQLMEDALNLPDFSFLDSWTPQEGSTFFPRVNQEVRPLTPEDRRLLKDSLTYLRELRSLLETILEALQAKDTTFSDQLGVFTQNGEISLIMVPVTSHTQKVLRAQLLSSNLRKQPRGEVFLQELDFILDQVPYAKSYLRWRWWPKGKETCHQEHRRALQILKAATGERNIFTAGELLQEQLKKVQRELTPGFWLETLRSIASLEDLPETAVMATLTVDQTMELKRSLSIIEEAFETRDTLKRELETALKTFRNQEVKKTLEATTLEQFSEQMVGRRFPRKRLEDLLIANSWRVLSKPPQGTVAQVLDLYQASPNLFTGVSFQEAIAVLQAYQYNLGEEIIPQIEDPRLGHFLKTALRFYLDQGDSKYPKRSDFKLWDRMLKSDAWEFVLLARDQKVLGKLLETARSYQDSDWLKELQKRPREVTLQEAQEFFRGRPAVFQTILSDLGVHRVALDKLNGFLAPELTEDILKLEVDTTFLKSSLRSYQEFGVKYAIHQKRVILGDEMGLGKTVTALALSTHLQSNGDKYFLSVVPLAVLENWKREVTLHTHFTPRVLYGNTLQEELNTWVKEGGFALTTFESLQKCNSLGLVPPELNLLIVDEAHYIKHKNTRRTQGVLPWLKAAQRVLLMSGTSLENKLQEFKTLISYVQPGIVFPTQMENYRGFREAVAPVYLRRNQEDVLQELPEKMDEEVYIELSEVDKQNYRRAANWHALRQAKVMAGRKSSTIQWVQERVSEAMENNHRVIIFSFYRETLAILQTVLKEDDPYTPLTGSLSGPERQAVVDKFNGSKKPGVLLAQVTAGGTGLNIQGASVVILMEPQVKPSLEEQAIARAYRMGQTQKVQVYRLRGKGTTDENLQEILNSKQHIFDETAGVSEAAALGELS